MKIANTSPFNPLERAKLSFADKAGAEKMVKDKGYQPTLYKGQRYAVKDGTAYPLDEKGVSLGDVGDLANETVNLGTAIPTFAASTVLGGGIPGAIAGGAISGAVGATAERGVGKLLGVRNTSLADEAKGVAGEALLGGATAGTFKAVSPLVSKTISAAGSKLTGAKNMISKLAGKGSTELSTLAKNEAERSFVQKANPIVPKWVNPANVAEKQNEVITYLKNKFGTGMSADKMLKKLSSDYKTLNSVSNKSVTNAPAMDSKGLLNLAQEMQNKAIAGGYDIKKGPGKKAFDYVGRRLEQALGEDGNVSVEELKKIYHELGKRGFGGEASRDFQSMYKDISMLVRDKLPANIKNILEEQAKINSALPGLIKSAAKEGKKSSVDSIIKALKLPSNLLAGKEILDMFRGK